MFKDLRVVVMKLGEEGLEARDSIYAESGASTDSVLAATFLASRARAYHMVVPASFIM